MTDTIEASNSFLPFEFCDRHHLDVARELIGCTLHWDDVAGMIVETEAYAANDDPACHTFFRESARSFFESNTPGTVYVYITYGMHWLLNVLTHDGIVLFRALEPTTGIATMQQRRRQTSVTALCSGPGKLGQAIGLGRDDHGKSLVTLRRGVRPRAADFDNDSIMCDIRVGLSTALDRSWRFLIAGNSHVSVPSGKAWSKRRTLRRN